MKFVRSLVSRDANICYLVLCILLEENVRELALQMHSTLASLCMFACTCMYLRALA